jgi:hypothetical protein
MNYEIIEGGQDVVINHVELACCLAEAATVDEMVQRGNHSEEDLMIEDPDDSETTIWTDEAQDVFDRWYDFYWDQIEKVKVKIYE